MDAQYKSLATVNPDMWVEHFKQTVGKPFRWGSDNEMAVLKKKSGGTATSSKDLPLNVVSPVEQFANMAKAEAADKGVPKYNAPSVEGKSSDSAGKRRKKKGKEKNKKEKKGRKKKKKNSAGKRTSSGSGGGKQKKKSHTKVKKGKKKKKEKSGTGDIFD